MVAYDIDTAAVLAAAQDAATELTPLASLTADLRDQVAGVEAALGSSRVARVFASYATNSLLHDLRSALSRAENAVRGVRQAAAGYLRGNEEMRARAEAAAAAVPDVSGRRTETAIPPAAPAIVPSAPLPKSRKPDSGAPGLPVPLPKPLPLPQKPEPKPESGPGSGTVAPLPGPLPSRPDWLFRPALPGRPPSVVARDLMLRLYYPCPGSWGPHPDCFRPRWPGPAYPPGAWLPRPGPAYPPGAWLPRWPGPAYPPGGWFPRWPGPAYPPGGWFPRWPGPAYPPGGWFPRWPEPGLPPRGRYPWWPARPLPELFPNPRIMPPPGHVPVWPLETERLPMAVALGAPEVGSGGDSSRKWGLT